MIPSAQVPFRPLDRQLQRGMSVIETALISRVARGTPWCAAKKMMSGVDSRPFLERLGFQITGEEENFYLLSNPDIDVPGGWTRERVRNLVFHFHEECDVVFGQYVSTSRSYVFLIQP